MNATELAVKRPMNGSCLDARVAKIDGPPIPSFHRIPIGWDPVAGWENPAVQRGAVQLGRAVRNARQRAGWSQRTLGRRSGVDQPSISRLERGMLPGFGFRRLAAIVAALPDVFGPA